MARFLDGFVARKNVVALATMLIIVHSVPSVAAFECIEMMPGTLFDTTDNCSTQPEIDRVFGSQVFTWGGTPYLVTNTGNDLQIWNIADPLIPVAVDDSRFHVGNVGDSDYDLENFSICDECRYGVANFKRGTVLIDFGEGDAPEFADFALNDGANVSPGAFTFMWGEQQYLIASTLDPECPAINSSLKTFNGIDWETDLDFLACVEAEGVQWTQIVGGIQIGDYLYLGDKSQRVFLYRVQESGAAIALEYLSTPMVAYMIRDKALAFDEEHGVAVQADSSGITIWDISDPSNPTEMGNYSGDFNRATVKFPIAWVAKKGFKHSEMTFDISNSVRPVPLDRDFWSSDKEWNYTESQCAEIQGAVFSPDGSALYLSRYAIMQVADVTPCAVAPEVGFTWAPRPPAVGGTVQFTDASVNGPTMWAWDFGDGETSDVQNPTHVFGAAGTYTVSLTVGNAYGDDSIARPVVVTDVPVSTVTRIYVPAAAAAPGAGGSFWSTDAEINNRGRTLLSYNIFLLERGADNSDPQAAGPFLLGPGKSVRYRNIVGDSFGFEGAGALAFEFEDVPEAVLASRTFNSFSSDGLAGTFGQGIPAVFEDDMIPADFRVRLIQLSQDEGFRSNIGFQNGTAANIRIFVEFFLADGTSLGIEFQDLAAYSNQQWNNAFAKVTDEDVADGYVDVWTENAGGLFTVYGSVVGNDDFNDPTTVVPQ